MGRWVGKKEGAPFNFAKIRQKRKRWKMREVKVWHDERERKQTGV